VTVKKALAKADPFTPAARLRVESPGAEAGKAAPRPAVRYKVEREAYVIPLGTGETLGEIK
jgi:hypothetical protein